MDPVELRRLIAAKLEAAKALGTSAEGMTDEKRTSFDALMSEVDTLRKDLDRAEKLATVEADVRSQAQLQPAVPQAPNVIKQRGDTESRAIADYIRTGNAAGLQAVNQVQREEQRASNANDMTIADSTYAGYLVPTGMYNQITMKRNENRLSDALGVTRIPGNGTTTNAPYDNGTANVFVSTAETVAFDIDAPIVGQKAFTLIKYSKQVILSYELLQDEDARLLDFVNNYVGRALANTHNNLLMAEALANGTSVTLGAVSAATASDIPTMIKNLKGEYADNAQFVMKRATQFSYLALTGNNWQFVNTPNGQVKSLWGYPVQNSEAVPAIGSGLKSMLFGNFNYMGLYEAPSLEFLRDPYSKSGNGQIVLNYYFRAVYGVLLPEAILYGKNPTA